jgi:hypothetical protein
MSACKNASGIGATACGVLPIGHWRGCRNRTGDVQFGKLAVPRCAVMPCEKNRGLPVTRCDAVTPRERAESPPVVTVLVTRLSRRSNQGLDGHSPALVDPAMDPTPLTVTKRQIRHGVLNGICPPATTFAVEGRAVA